MTAAPTRAHPTGAMSAPPAADTMRELESEAIQIIREVVAEFDRPALLFSGGKDSAGLLHLARKATWPAPLPITLVHVDTGHNLPEVLEYRDRVVRQGEHTLVVARVEEWIADGRLVERPDGTRNPLQTIPLLDTIAEHRFDAVLGGARRDEDRARAKERIFSVRDAFGGWDPRKQRPELWTLYNGRHAPGEHTRVFPLSNWTELDVWHYIAIENIELPSIYYAHERPVWLREGMWLTPGPWGQPRANRTAADQDRSLPHRRRRLVHRSCRVDGRHSQRHHRRTCRQPAHRTRRHPRRRPPQRGRHGRPQARGLLLMTATTQRSHLTPSQDPTLSRRQLRLVIAGSVDDGKSTLVGRLLHDTKSILVDQYDAIEAASRRRGSGDVDLALLTDGLRAEREQGITIDVAYRYFTTPRRSFIVADTPGHTQYTRNTVTGASTADAALILVDVRNGVSVQTRRHLAVMALLRVPHVVVAVNKMDAVAWQQEQFDTVAAAVRQVGDRLGLSDLRIIPISALTGAYVADPATDAAWYDGPTLLQVIEDLDDHLAADALPFRMPVQLVIRPRTAAHPDYRGLAGRVASGTVSVGDSVLASPSGVSAQVSGIDTPRGPVHTAHAGESVTLLLSSAVDIGRGQTLAHPDQAPSVHNELQGVACWLDERPGTAGQRLVVKVGTQVVRGLIGAVGEHWHVDDQRWGEAGQPVQLNDIVRLQVRLAEPVAVDDYRTDRATGAFLLIDPATGSTVAAGMVGDVLDPAASA